MTQKEKEDLSKALGKPVEELNNEKLAKIKEEVKNGKNNLNKNIFKILM